MTQIIIGYADAATGINETREANVEEAKELIESQANALKNKNEQLQLKTQNETKRQELLTRLGITQDEVKLLLSVEHLTEIPTE